MLIPPVKTNMTYCPECGGEMHYAIATKHYICKSCGLSVTQQELMGTARKTKTKNETDEEEREKRKKRIPEMVAKQKKITAQPSTFYAVN